MNFVSRFLSLSLFALAGCAPGAEMGNPDADAVINLVVRSEGPFQTCLEVTSVSGLVAEFPSDYEAPNNGGWDVGQFEDFRTVGAAKKVAVGLQEAVDMERNSKVLFAWGASPEGSGRCAISLSYPTFSGEFAFLSFKAPNGDMGHYALEHDGSGWRIKERVSRSVW